MHSVNATSETIGTSLAEASISLESCLAKFLDAEAEAATTGIPPSQNPNQGLYQKFNDIQTNLHTALQQVERIFSTPCDTQDDVELLRQTVKVSNPESFSLELILKLA